MAFLRSFTVFNIDLHTYYQTHYSSLKLTPYPTHSSKSIIISFLCSINPISYKNILFLVNFAQLKPHLELFYVRILKKELFIEKAFFLLTRYSTLCAYWNYWHFKTFPHISITSMFSFQIVRIKMNDINYQHHYGFSSQLL